MIPKKLAFEVKAFYPPDSPDSDSILENQKDCE